MATGMGPSSSGSQATVASVVTSTLLAGLGVGGGVISSLPSSVYPTQAPHATPQNPTRPSTTPSKSNTEQTAPQGADEDKQTEEKKATEEEEEGGEKEGEQEEEEEQDEKKRKNKNSPDYEEKQANSTVAKEPLIPTPASTAKEKGEGKTTVKDTTVLANTDDEQLVEPDKRPTDVNAVSTPEPRNDSAEMQIPQSSTVSPMMSSDAGKLWPFSVHTGKETFFSTEDTFSVTFTQKNNFFLSYFFNSQWALLSCIQLSYEERLFSKAELCKHYQQLCSPI